MSMTIKELAEALGVSKTAVRKHMSEDFRLRYTKTRANGVITIDSAGCNFIATIMGRNLVCVVSDEVESANQSENQVSDEVLKILKDTISTLQEQLQVKDAQISQLTAALENTTASLQEAQTSLRAEQALHAGSMKQLMDGSETAADKDEPERKGLFRRIFRK